MKALVTGATGFIGSNVVRALLARGAVVRAFARPGGDRRAIAGLPVEVAEGDLLDGASLLRAARGCDALFHAGAWYAFWPPDHRRIEQANAEGTRNALEAARAAGIRRVVYTSSVGAIGARADGGVADEASPPNLRAMLPGYQRSKHLAEQEALRQNSSGLEVVLVSPTAPVGPWDVKPTPTGRIVVDFLKGRMFGYVHTGLNIVHVADVAQGHVLAAEKGVPGQRYILGNRNMTLREIFEMLSGITGRRAPRLRVPYGVALAYACVDEWTEGRILRRTPRASMDAVRHSRLPMYFDASRARRELGLPQTPVEQAFAEAVAWFRAHGYA